MPINFNKDYEEERRTPPWESHRQEKLSKGKVGLDLVLVLAKCQITREVARLQVWPFPFAPIDFKGGPIFYSP
jgi:hypothetical protein